MEPTVFSEGFTLKDMLDSRGFTLTADSEMKRRVFDVEEDFFNEENEEILSPSNYGMFDKHMEVPKYHSFDDLEKTMKDADPSGAVKISVIEEGTGDLVPSDGYVRVHYAAYWENEQTPFDNTMAWNNADPVRLRMGYGAIMPGLEIGLSCVRGPTAKFNLLLRPEAMCGKLGALPRIRPERALYCICLVSVEDIGLVDRYTSLPSAEQQKFSVAMETVQASNAHAKTLFSQRKFEKATRNYFMSLEVMNLCRPETQQEMDDIEDMMCKVYTNLAVCYSQMERWKKVLLMCESLSKIRPITDNVQALFLNGKAESRLGEYSEALRYLKMALKLKPQNDDVARELADLDTKIAKAKAQEKQMWKGAFKSDAKKDEPPSCEEFRREMSLALRELSGREGRAELRLPRRTTEGEASCVRELLREFQGLVLVEGGLNKYRVVKSE